MNCQKENFNGCCCCNCVNHLKDFHHCITQPKPEGVDGCVCSIQKGWICKHQSEDTEEARYYSGWGEHGMCEMHQSIKEKESVHLLLYNPDCYDSVATTLSIHRTYEGASKAMEAHKQKVFAAWDFSCKENENNANYPYDYNRWWGIEEIEIND